jgi:hypothetical protein
MTARIFAAPIRYIQDAGALAQLPALLAGHGARPCILADAAAPEALRLDVEQQLRGSTASVILAFCPAPCTEAEIERLCETARARGGYRGWSRRRRRQFPCQGRRPGTGIAARHHSNGAVLSCADEPHPRD